MPKRVSNTTTQIVAKEGWLLVALLYVAFLVFVSSELEILAFISIVALFAALYFYRNPERVPEEKDKNAIIAPIDGEVVSIKNTQTKTVIKIKKGFGDLLFIRSPIEGDIKESKRVNGISATNEDIARCINEKASITIGETKLTILSILFENGAILYEQKDNSLIRGERVGILRYGYVELEIPHMTLKVAQGDKVKSGTTLIGYRS